MLSSIAVAGQSVQAWTASTINVSDADPSSVPGSTDPFNYFALVGSSTTANNATRAGFLDATFGRLFTESGSTTGSSHPLPIRAFLCVPL